MYLLQICLYVQTKPGYKESSKKKVCVPANPKSKPKIKTIDGVCKPNQVLKNLCESMSKHDKKQVKCWKEATECTECQCVCCSVQSKSQRINSAALPYVPSRQD